jgi:hypothetical protein
LPVFSDIHTCALTSKLYVTVSVTKTHKHTHNTSTVLLE